MATLIIAEHDNKKLNPNTLAALGAAAQIGNSNWVLVVGYECHLVAEEVSKYRCVDEVIWVDHSVYKHHLAENSAELIIKLVSGVTHILGPASTFGKNLLPRVAALLNVGQISDVIQVVDQVTFIRPIYAGNALETIESLDPIKIMTIRTTAFIPSVMHEQSAPIREEKIVVENKRVRFVGRELTQSERPDLTVAKIVVSGGRGFQSTDKFKLLEGLAKQLGAAIGASRAAVDAGFVSNDYQVGQTGKVVAPDLYLAIGISGAVQHLAGMKDSKVIVAINKDPDAPIFKVSDYGIVGDLFKILPELQEELSKLGYH